MPRPIKLLLSAGALALLLGACASKKTTDAPPAAPAQELADRESEAAEGDAGVAEEGGALDMAESEDDAGASPELSLAEYEAMLAEQERRMQVAGIRLAHLGEAARPESEPAPDAFPGATKSSRSRTRAEKRAEPKKKVAAQPGRGDVAGADGVDPCQLVCDLAASTCDLEQKICALAGRHEGEERYQQVCARAHEDCRAASTACTGCNR